MRYLTFLTGLLMATALTAQTNALGLRAGLGFFDQRIAADGIAIELDERSGISAALFYEIGLTPYLSLQPELAFTQKGHKVVSEDGYQSIELDGQGNVTSVVTDIEQRVRYNYLEVPLLAKGHYGNEQLRGYALLGPSVGYLLGGDYVEEFGGERTEMPLELTEEEGVNRLELSLVAGAGLAYRIGTPWLLAEVRYARSLTSLIDSEEDFEAGLYNRGIQLSVGLQLPLAGR